MQTLTPEIPTATSKPPDPEEDREPLFQAHGLTKVYPSGDVEVRALNGVDLELFEGELVVLLGTSGSGKSTLLNILGGLVRGRKLKSFFPTSKRAISARHCEAAARRGIRLARRRFRGPHARVVTCHASPGTTSTTTLLNAPSRLK
jgi:ABC-type glutathione transport system ATPase component